MGLLIVKPCILPVSFSFRIIYPFYIYQSTVFFLVSCFFALIFILIRAKGTRMMNEVRIRLIMENGLDLKILGIYVTNALGKKNLRDVTEM